MTTTIKQKVTKVALMGAIALGCAGAATSAALVETAANPSIAHADQWQYSNGGWWLQTNNGYATGWKQIKGTWYYFDHNGWMKTGWQKIGGKWYNFGNDGAMITGWNKINYTWYRHDDSGALQTGWIEEYPGWHYADSSGAIVTGWNKIGSKWYYFDWAVGAMQTGWQHIDNKWYYFNDDGAMQTGWQELHSTGTASLNWYYFDSSGAMVTDWNKIGSSWYYFNGSGAMQIGWQKIGGKWYHFKGNGAMDTNKWIGDYYVKSDGSMATSQWIGKYYVDASGQWDKALSSTNPLHVVTDWYELDLPTSWKNKVSYSSSNDNTHIYLTGNENHNLFGIFVSSNQWTSYTYAGNYIIYQKQTPTGAWVNMYMPDWVMHARNSALNNQYDTNIDDKQLAQLITLQTGGKVSLDQIKANPEQYIENNANSEFLVNEIASTIKFLD